MGCFASKNKSASPLPSRAPPPPRSPPPYLLEESVKEVLSETPKLRSTTPRISETQSKIAPLHQNVQYFQEKNVQNKHKIENQEEVSEVSEINSCISESYSTTTERRDNEEVGEFRRRLESPEKFKRRAYSGELHRRRVANSPARRPDQPSPNRARIVPGRDRRVDAGNVKDVKPIRDAGESSRRRSRSPVIRNDNVGSRQIMGRSPSVRKTGKSPGRVRSDLSENARRGEGTSNKEGKWPPTSNELLSSKKSNELLENPLVSLECFIFL